MGSEAETADEFSGLARLFRDGDDWSGRGDGPERRRRRAHRRRAWIVTGITAVVVLTGMGGYAAWALNAPLRPPTVTSQAPQVAVPAAAAIALPQEGASAIGITGGDGYFSAAPQQPQLTSGSSAARPMASISKLITALVILDAHPLSSATDPGPTITFGTAAHALYDTYYSMGAAIAPMPTGTRMSLHDALAVMLLPSAANYADALATWAFGSRGAFVAAAHRWLSQHGLNETTMVEPTGMSTQNTSTPGNLLALGRLAEANPAIAAITATSTVTVPGAGTVVNTNDLLGTDGITGLKTGNFDEGTFNLLYTATLQPTPGTTLHIVGVMLGGDSHDSTNADVTHELESIQAGFHTVPLATAGQKLGVYTTPWGSSARMVVRDDASILTWSNTPVSVSLKTTAPKSYRNGETVGTLTWKAGPQTATARVGIEGSIAPPSAWWRLTHPTELGG